MSKNKMKKQSRALKATTAQSDIPVLIQQKASLYAFGVALLPHADARAQRQLKKDLRTMKKQVLRVCKGDDQLLILNTQNVMMAYEGAKLEGEEAFSACLEEFAGVFRKGVVNVLGRKLK